MICPNCSHRIDGDAICCPVCGYRVTESPEVSALPWYGDPPGTAYPYPSYMNRQPVVQPTYPGQPPFYPAPYAPQAYPGAPQPYAPPAPYPSQQPLYPFPQPVGAPLPGYPIGGPVSPVYLQKPVKPGNRERNWFSVAGMICGILSLPCVFSPIAGFLIGATAFGFSLHGLPSQRKGMSIAGIACGVIGVLLGAIVTIYVLRTGNQDAFL